MNWIERMYELKGCDLYSQNGESFYLEYVAYSLNLLNKNFSYMVDIGGGDGFYLSNTRHLTKFFSQIVLDLENGYRVDASNVTRLINENLTDTRRNFIILSVDTDGNDYWIMDVLLTLNKIPIIIAEFNPAFTDSRTIAYNPAHEWAGDDYYGFSFAAGEKLAEKHGYKVIFQIADMNMIMVRKDLIEGLYVPEVSFKQNHFFKKSERTDWVMV